MALSLPITYNSYSGTDIVAQLTLPGELLILGELQTISYSTHRENTPVRFLGHVSPAAFIRGPRTVAGSLIFTTFNEYAFYRLTQCKQDILSGLYPLSDMLPLFDVTISFINEFGAMSQMMIYGISIVDEGSTMSIDDLIVEQVFTYMAQGIVPMTSVATQNANFVTQPNLIPPASQSLPLSQA